MRLFMRDVPLSHSAHSTDTKREVTPLERVLYGQEEAGTSPVKFVVSRLTSLLAGWLGG